MTTDTMTSPYRGLTPYTEADAAYFFGRTAEIANVAANLEVARLTIFYGPSGVGKSSVLRAGVIHQLRQRARQNVQTHGAAEIIPIYFDRWHSDPLAGLVQAVEAGIEETRDQRPGDQRPGGQRPEARDQRPGDVGLAVSDLRSPISTFSTYLRDQSQRTASDLLLVLDQFEEYFLYHPDEAGPGSFAQELVAILTTPDLRVNVLLALREDALARLDLFKGQIPFLLDNRLSIGHLGRAAGEEAIRRPLAQYNQDQGAAITIEPALMEAVLDQVGSGRVSLSQQGAGARDSVRPLDAREQIEAPYLQLVLTRLWDEERANQSAALRMTTLDSLGGAETIVRNYLDDTLAALEPADQTLAAGFFDRLVTPSGTKIALSLDEIAQYTGRDRDTVEDLLNRLQGRRLLRGVQSPGGVTQYEIFHDVLGQAMLDWQARYRRTQAEAARLAEEQAARAEAERRTQEAEARSALEERARAAAQAYSQRLRRLVFGLAAVLILALAAIGFALVQTRLVTGFSLAVQAQSFARDQNLRLATLLALEARQLNSTQGERVLENEIPFQVPFNPWKLLPGHSDDVLSVAWSPDGRQLASGSRDNTIIVWDAASGERVRTLAGHSDDVWSVAWSPDGRQLASGSRDNTIIVWDAASGEWVRTLAGHSDDVLSVAWSPDGRQLASGSRNNTIIVWDAASGERVRTLAGHSDDVLSVAWSPDGRQLASGSRDNTIIVWDAASGEWVRTLAGHSDDVLSVAWSPDGRQLASGSRNNTIIVWDAASGERVRTLAGHSDAVWSVAWSPDGRQLASGSWDNTIIVWDAASGERVRTLAGHSDDVLSVAWSPDGRQLASGSSDNTIIVWDAASGERVRTLAGHSDAVLSVAWSPDGRQLASGSSDNTIIVWDAASGERVRTLAGHSDDVLSVAWSPDGRQLASGSWDNTIIVWDAASGERVRTLAGHSDDVLSVAWSPDGRQLASGSWDNTIIVWDAASGERVRTLAGHSDTVLSVAWSPDGQQLASGSWDNTIIVWDAASGERVRTLAGHSDDVWSVAWSPDGRQLASGSRDNTIIVWDAASGERVRTLAGHSDDVLSVAWSPDGRQLASGSWDNTIIVWDAASGERVRTLAGHSDDVWSVAWSPDGRQLASGSRDNTIIVYPSGYLAPPCSWARSNLTVDEWVRFRGRALYQPTCPDYASQSVPGVVESLDRSSPEYLFLTIPGRLFVVGAVLLLLAVVVVPFWDVFWIVRRFLRRRRARRLAAAEDSGSQ